MFWQKHPVAALVFATFLLISCGDDSKSSSNSVNGTDEGFVTITDKTISGVSQKGPFVNGSSVTVQELDGETLAQTGGSFEGKIKNDMGEFSVKVKKLESQYALLKATGFYRNEVTGGKSKSQVTLYALTDLSNRDEVNVNLLTHLAHERTLYLATEKGLSVAEAKKQAESEVLKSFGIEGDFAAAEDLNIFGESDQNAALLAISILMQGDLSEADFSERLANYAADIETDGIWNDSKTATKIADWANEQSLGSGLTKIREKITKWELSADVPMFEKYVNNYWWQKYGLGTCESKREGEVLKNQNVASTNANEYYICKSGAWEIAGDIEKDTYMWLDPTAKRTEKDGDVRYGDVVTTNCYVFEDKTWRSGNSNDCSLDLRGCTKLRQDTVGKGSDKAWYICDAKTWRNATTYEKDTFGWKDSTDGVIKKGNVTDSVYVFDKTAWRTATNVESKLGGCTEALTGSVNNIESIYYICKSSNWTDASALEYDTYKWADGKDGDSKTGSVNTKNCYVFENNAWRIGNSSDCSLGLRGCTNLRQDTVALGSDKVWHICDNKVWRNATDIEKDTATWGAGSFDGEVRAGQINTSFYYIYKTSKATWRDATTLEKDTYDYTNNKNWSAGTDSEIKKGSVTDSFYVFDNTTWRAASNVEAKLGGCAPAIADSVGKVGPSYYICKSKKWIEASAIEYDTYRWATGKDGDSKVGNVNTNNCYVYDTSAVYNGWREGNSNDCLLNLGGCTRGLDGVMNKASSGNYFVCDANSWRDASADEEKNCKIGGFCNACTEHKHGVFEIRGETQYVCETKQWRKANCAEIATKNLCTANDSAVVWDCEDMGNFKIDYICSWGKTAEWKDKLMWHPVRSPFEYKLVDWEKKKTRYYTVEVHPNAIYGNDFIDPRDNNVYKTVTINGIHIFAENLRYADSLKTANLKGESWCYNNEEKNCAIGGRYYTWTAAVNMDSKWQNALASELINNPHKGICPDGWHIPTKEEWITLFSGVEYAAQQMMGYDIWENATDYSGFSAFPADYYDESMGFQYVGFNSYFLSVSEQSNYSTYHWKIYYNGNHGALLDYGNNSVGYKNDGLTVRCFEDKKNEE